MRALSCCWLAMRPAQEIRRKQAQLFGRMVFNILMHNTDDYEKNHALPSSATVSWLTLVNKYYLN